MTVSVNKGRRITVAEISETTAAWIFDSINSGTQSRKGTLTLFGLDATARLMWFWYQAMESDSEDYVMSIVSVKELLEIEAGSGVKPVVMTTEDGLVFEVSDDMLKSVCVSFAMEPVIDADVTMADYAFDWFVDEAYEEALGFWSY